MYKVDPVTFFCNWHLDRLLESPQKYGISTEVGDQINNLSQRLQGNHIFTIEEGSLSSEGRATIIDPDLNIQLLNQIHQHLSPHSIPRRLYQAMGILFSAMDVEPEESIKVAIEYSNKPLNETWQGDLIRPSFIYEQWKLKNGKERE